MIKSMTGYGKANLTKKSKEYQVEIKSVNHRYLDLSVKMPKVLSYLEEEVKKEIATQVKRGKIDVFITFQNDSTEGKEIKINTELAKIYIDELKKLAEQEKILANIEVTEISKFPDVLSIQNKQEDETIKKELLETVALATEKLVQMRGVEGNKIAEDLLGRIKAIQNKVKEISSQSTGLIEEYVVKLEGRIKEILKNQELDEARLNQEVVIYADKCSIEEEVTRLNSHISQFEGLLNSEEAVGKKLDFIIQEMNRETNTIGSKANKLEITNGVIEIKTELENIREQIQNVE
ncbi:MAG: YicC family protein [Clostridia bacterium]|nr:YicC family protein [Clostridia bacterium]